MALAIVALAVFPCLQITQSAEELAFNAKFTSLACNRIRALLSDISAVGKPGDYGEGDLTDLSDEQGFDERFAYATVGYEWRVEEIDLRKESSPNDAEEDDGFGSDDSGGDDLDSLGGGEEDDKMMVRYVRISIFYQTASGEEQDVTVETYLPALPKKGKYQIPDAVPPNRGNRGP